VLWERGWINVGNINQYTDDGRNDVFGVFQPHASFKYLMGNCKDFEEEESLLQLKGRKMGVIVDQTSKCHCKLAGEGIEYSWGCAKNFYHHLPLRGKKSKESFKVAVRKCLSKDVLMKH
jgi:hypothetical protein